MRILTITCDLCKKEMYSEKSWLIDINPNPLWASDNRIEVCAPCVKKIKNYINTLSQ